MAWSNASIRVPWLELKAFRAVWEVDWRRLTRGDRSTRNLLKLEGDFTLSTG
jgi:hypothetical protein